MKLFSFCNITLELERYKFDALSRADIENIDCACA